MANLLSELDEVSNLVVLVQNQTTPSKEDWDAFLVNLRRQLARAGGGLCRGLSFVDGGPATASQRAALKEVVGKNPNVRTALVTDDPMTRGISTVVSWFLPSMVVAPSHDWGRATGFLALSEKELAWARESAARSSQSVGRSLAVQPFLSAGQPVRATGS